MRFTWGLVAGLIAIIAVPAAQALDGPPCPTVTALPAAVLPDFKSLPFP